MNNAQDMLDNVLWTNETKEEMFGHNLQPISTNTSHQLSSTVVVEWWFEVLQHAAKGAKS